MAKITKDQLYSLWAEEYAHKGHCCLCGNHGTIDNRGKIFTPAGFECGKIVFCICPNGRNLKKFAKKNNIDIEKI